MIFIKGILSLIQILFLPGVIFLKFFQLPRRVFQTIGYVFGLSLIFNFFWILLLTSLKINYSILHYILFITEICLVFWLYKEKILISIEEVFTHTYSFIIEALYKLMNLFVKKEDELAFSRIIKSILTIIFLIWTISSLLWLSRVFIDNFGTVFKEWDAVVSWNRWATEWFNNTIPSPNRYPQLIPANFSITYSFMRSADIQIFAKSIMPLFTMITWLLFLDLAFEYENPGFFIGIVILRYLTKKFLGEYIGEGYVDVALLFFSFLTIYTLLKAEKSKSQTIRTSYVYLGAIFAAGTSLTKQNGLLIFLIYPLLAFLILTKKSEHTSIWERLKFLIKPMLLGLLILLPWYILNESRILLGRNWTNVEYLISADRHSGRSFIERGLRAIEMLGIYKYLFIVVLITLPFIQKKFRQIALITIFPYSLIWMFLFSIFTRNLAMVFPFLAVFAGLGLFGLMNFSLKLLKKIKLHQIKAIFFLVPILVAIWALSLHFKNATLAEIQIKDQKNALLPKLNHELYNYFDSEGKYGMIMTQYPIEYLPYLENFKILEPFSIYEEFYFNFVDHPEVEYFLVWDKYASNEVKEKINSFEEDGFIELRFEAYNASFYEVQDRASILNESPN